MAAGPLRTGRVMTVGVRLWLINALLAVAIVVVAVQGRYALDQHRAFADHLSALRLAQHYHRKAQLSQFWVQAEVTHSLRARELGVEPKREALVRIRDQAESVRAMLRELEALPLPEDLRAAHRALQPEADRYVQSARRVVALSDRDASAAMKEAPEVGRAFDQLRATLQEQTDRIDRLLASAEAAARDEQRRVQQQLVGLAVVVLVLACTLVMVIARSLRHSLRSVSAVARRIAAGELGVRAPAHGYDELGELGDAINSMAQNLEGMIDQLRSQSQEDAFASQLDDALEMADSEAQAREVVAQAMVAIAADMPMELLLADADRMGLSAAASHPKAGAPGCRVDTAAACVAVRRGTTQVFPDSGALNACPHLRGRGGLALAAVCVPMSFMGRSLGVLHATLPVQAVPEAACVHRLNNLGMQAGTRIGTLRSIRRTQLQADTDALTGLLNRRALKRAVEGLEAAGQPYAVVMTDIDHFKRLNDNHGHDTGDRALQTFAGMLVRAAGDDGLAARWGGEEFLLVIGGADALRAYDVAEGLRAGLPEGLPAGMPPFTASFGVSDSVMAGGFSTAVDLADAALYRSKDGGRNRVTVAGPGRGSRPASQEAGISLDA